MINRGCISINNRCNLNCTYCHFHTAEKKAILVENNMNVYKILDNIKEHITKHSIEKFKLGFVGNGEPLLDFNLLRSYIEYIGEYTKSGKIASYTITNGILINEEILKFFKKYNINVGFSIDGIAEIHNKYRCNTFETVLEKINLYKKVNGKYPSMNCTVSPEIIEKDNETIDFFQQFDSRITFSRMIGKGGISLEEFHKFLEKASLKLNVRTGGYDCTMYGGKCGAGINNIFYANGKIYICGNCVDLPTRYSYDTPLDKIDFDIKPFDRKKCYKECLK